MSTTIELDTNLKNVCCKGFNWQVCLIFPDCIWGICQNPNCPHREFDGDPYQGVWWYSLENLEERTGLELEQ